MYREFEKKIVVRSNIYNTEDYKFLDLNSICSKINTTNSLRWSSSPEVNKKCYDISLRMGKLLEHSSTLCLYLSITDSDTFQEVEPRYLFDVFESVSECKRFLQNLITKYIENINNEQIEVRYVSDDDYNYEVRNGKLYMPVYDFEHNMFYPIPEVKTLILKLEIPEIDKLVDSF